MAEFKDGDRVRVTLEGTVSMTDKMARWFHLNTSPGRDVTIGIRDAQVEVIEEPYEEGAIYEFDSSGGYVYRMAYLPEAGDHRPWVYISGEHGFIKFGERFHNADGRGVKLAPVEQ